MRVVSLDIETTGLDLEKDEIIEIAMVLFEVKNKEVINLTKLQRRYLPNVPISNEAYQVHGISMKELGKAPKFGKKDAEWIRDLIVKPNYVTGYNIKRFDLPMIARHLNEHGVKVTPSDILVIDFKAYEEWRNPRGLKDVYKRTFGKDLEGHHEAMADTMAVVDLIADDLGKTAAFLANKDKFGLGDIVDFSGKFYRDGKGRICYGFGKYKGIPVLDSYETKQYAEWILGAAFPPSMKAVIEQLLEQHETI